MVARRESNEGDMGPKTVKAPAFSQANGDDRLVDGQMPDLLGLSAREALRTLTRIGLTARMTGNGVVVEQWPAAGTVLGRDNGSVLTLGRRATAPATGASQ